MRILIFSDSRWRDSFGHALLKTHLPQHNTQVVSFDVWQQALHLFKPHMVLLNHLHGNRNKTIANHIKRQGGRAVVLPSEGRPNSQAQEDWYVRQLGDPDLDLFLSWSDQIQHKKSVTVGCPRFEIYHRYRSLIESKGLFCDKYGLDVNKPIIAITSSFPQAKFSYRQIKFNQQDWQDLGVSSIEGREDPLEFAQRDYAHFQKFKLCIRVCMDTHPQYQYILKPHPMEDLGMWEDFCDELGITLVRQEYIFNFLNACDSLIAKIGCITIQEAWLLGKPTLQLKLSDELTGAAKEAYEVGWKIASPKWFMHYDPIPNIKDVYLERMREYLDKYGYTLENVVQQVADTLQQLPRAKLRQEPSVPDLIQFHKVLREHSIQKETPSLEDMHLGKSVTQDIINEWERRINESCR